MKRKTTVSKVLNDNLCIELHYQIDLNQFKMETSLLIGSLENYIPLTESDKVLIVFCFRERKVKKGQCAHLFYRLK